MPTEREETLLELRKELRQSRDRLHHRMREIHGDQQRGTMDLEKDPDDQAIQLENDEVLDALEPATRRELQDVLAALERWEEGKYGECLDCGDEIALKRLEALPSALRCIQCEEQVAGTGTIGKGPGTREQVRAGDFGDFVESGD